MNTNNTTLENNILIYEFLYPVKEGYEKLTNTASQTLHYHDFWDWLMPVVEKIESLSSSQNVIDWSRQSKNIFDIKLTESKMETVYNAVIEFIKWYNENSAKKE